MAKPGRSPGFVDDHAESREGAGGARAMSAVVLTGFMGTGKTTVGRLLAQRLHKPFADTDVQIEELEGRTIAQIFADAGEPYFREVEQRVIDAAMKSNAVVATGGGAILDRTNYERMQAAGPIVCLTADADVIVARTARDNTRPLLDIGERSSRIRQLLSERAAAYARADFTIDTSTQTAEGIVEEILSFLRHRSQWRREVQQ
jgi:shikimate kinase